MVELEGVKMYVAYDTDVSRGREFPSNLADLMGILVIVIVILLKNVVNISIGSHYDGTLRKLLFEELYA
jgi:hypothetical protein